MKIGSAILGAALISTAATAGPMRNNEIRLQGGLFTFDLAGVGSESYVRAAYAKPLGERFTVSAGASFARTLQQYAVRIPYLIPEAGVEYGRRFGFAEPFIGSGAGLIVDMRADIPDSASFVVNSGSGIDVSTVGIERNPLEPSFFAEAGLKFHLPNRTGAIILSSKIRGHGADFSGLSTETGIGISTGF